MIFQFTPSVWRETAAVGTVSAALLISIHSLRVEGDSGGVPDGLSAVEFQSTPSVWRETLFHSPHHLQQNAFQSTPSVWRETRLLDAVV